MAAVGFSDHMTEDHEKLEELLSMRGFVIQSEPQKAPSPRRTENSLGVHGELAAALMAHTKHEDELVASALDSCVGANRELLLNIARL